MQWWQKFQSPSDQVVSTPTSNTDNFDSPPKTNIFLSKVKVHVQLDSGDGSCPTSTDSLVSGT